MQNIEIAIVKTAVENLSKLNDKIYFAAKKEGYHQMVSKSSAGVQTAIYVFNNLENREEVEAILNDFEFSSDAQITFGPVIKISEYIATEFSKSPKRLKVTAEGGESFSLPITAKSHLKLD